MLHGSADLGHQPVELPAPGAPHALGRGCTGQTLVLNGNLRARIALRHATHCHDATAILPRETDAARSACGSDLEVRSVESHDSPSRVHPRGVRVHLRDREHPGLADGKPVALLSRLLRSPGLFVRHGHGLRPPR